MPRRQSHQPLKPFQVILAASSLRLHSLDVVVGVDARGVARRGLPIPRRFCKSDSVTTQAQRCRVGYLYASCIDNAGRKIALCDVLLGGLAEADLDYADPRDPVVDGGQRELALRVRRALKVSLTAACSAVVSLAGRSGRGRSSDKDGVAIGCAKSGESKVIRYCGPTAKLVSWAAAIPTSMSDRHANDKHTSNKRRNLPMRIESLRKMGISPATDYGATPGEMPESLGSACGSRHGFSKGLLFSCLVEAGFLKLVRQRALVKPLDQSPGFPSNLG